MCHSLGALHHINWGFWQMGKAHTWFTAKREGHENGCIKVPCIPQELINTHLFRFPESCEDASGMKTLEKTGALPSTFSYFSKN